MVFDSAAAAGGLAVVSHLWWLFWVCLGVTVLSVPAGKVTGIMNDTVLAGDPSLQAGQEGTVAEGAVAEGTVAKGAVAEGTGSAVDPGVDVGAPRAVSSLDASN